MTPDHFILMTFLAGILGVFGALLGLFGLLSRRPRALGWRILGLVFGGAAAGCAVVAAMLGQPFWSWAPLLGLGLVSAFGNAPRFAVLSRAGATLANLLGSRRLQAGVLLAGAPLVALWWVSNLFPEEPDALPAISVQALDRSQMQEVTTASAFTDLGRPIKLYRMPPDSAETDSALREGESGIIRDRVARLLRTAPPDTTHNCHGWVFAGGHFWVKGESVDMILQDNGYQPVTEPQSQDVVVYRSPAGEVLHTGLVRSADRGVILVEGKWGGLGRYVHLVEDQTYGLNYTFHRGVRQGHVLQGLDESRPATGSTISPADVVPGIGG